MKINYVYTLAIAGLLAIALMGSSGGRATSANSGNTGAPGDSGPTCITCHGTNPNIQVSLKIDLTDDSGTSITSYVPGTRYQGSVTVSTVEGMPVANGFQIVAIAAALNQDGPSINTFADPSNNAQITEISNGRQYVEHSRPSENSNVFEFSWLAPDNLSGPVTFYSCGNGVNLNGSTGGDNAACSTLVLQPRPLSTENLRLAAELEVAPNPVQDQLNLRVSGNERGNYTARVFDVAGKQWLERELTLTGGEDRFAIPAYDLPQGLYYLQLTNGIASATLRVVKQ